jgi:2-amino-4-hydroxy-6-hydroxymethyldihydropteridine diphosphokinase
MNRVYLSLGSNIRKEQNLPAAVRMLRKMGRVVAVSAVYETAPRGTMQQPSFFNAAVLLETPHGPTQIKDELIATIERALDRQRQADRNAPRTIDIDIALFNDEVLDYVPADGRPRHIPDPDLLLSVHAIVPMAEIAPDKHHPETGQLLSVIAAQLLEEAGKDDAIWLRKDISLET